jgi:hypothetical protein
VINSEPHLLLSLPYVSGTPTLAATANKFAKPWIDHRLEWQGDYLHPEQNSENYGMVCDAHDGVLRLMLNDSLADKQMLLIRLIQLDIDNYALVHNGGYWGSVGGSIGVGRKLPILFARVRECRMSHLITTHVQFFKKMVRLFT